MINAIFYMNRSGCGWRHLPHDFPPWTAVYQQFRRWKEQGLYGRILDTLWADMGYNGEDAQRIVRTWGYDLDIVKRAQAKGFVPQFKRWVVERTFAWLGKFRRLSKDYEFRVSSSVSMIYLAMIRTFLKQLETKR